PNNEKIAFKNAALEFSTVESTDPNEVPDTVSSSPSTSTTPTFGKKATSTIGSSNQDQDENNTVLTTSDSAVSSPIFYACVVLGAVGLVGAVVASRAKDNRDVSVKCLATTEAPAITPPLAVAHPSVWAPPASEVHVVIDDHSTKDVRLPLGAVQTADGEVVVPASRRADGSTRKPIRIRQGYVPQDEVPKYKTVAQRRREQEAKRAAEAKTDDAVVDELPMDKLSLDQKEEAPVADERSRSGGRNLQQGQKWREQAETKETTDGKSGDRQQQLKRQLTKINKQLKEITKLENASLSTQQQQKIARKSALQQQRNDIIAELNGATIELNMAEDSATVPVVSTEKKGPLHFEDEAGLFKTVCRTFMRSKKCTRTGCKFVHDKQLCLYYWKTGQCKFGDECRKNHFVTLPDPNANEEEPTSVASGGEELEKKKKSAKKSKDKKPNEKDEKAEINKTKDNKANANKTKEEKAKDVEKQETDKKAKKKKKNERRQATKKNTENFEPMTKPVDLRITYDLGSKDDRFSTPLTSRDVVLVPNLFSDFKKGELYAKLMHELDNCGIPREQLLKMWHGNDKIDGTHLIVDDHSSWKAKCPTFDLVTDRLKKFFSLDIKATRFNWYKDTSQWKPFHFDAAAVKPHIAAIQNFTVGISFGATRDAAFEHAKTKTVVSVPQPDGCVYAFAKDTNVIWRHGILQDVPVRDEGRISVIAWGWVDNMADVASPVAPAS
ncbi:hypothetical protein PHPALM_37168, partial [Phytophthora palmivora]